MKPIRNMSIRTKQIFIIMLASGVGLALACSVFFVSEVFAFKREIAKNISVLADAVGSNCAAAIDFNDAQVAVETLAALSADGNIVGAAIYTEDDSLFATYGHEEKPDFVFPASITGEAYGGKFSSNLFSLFHPIQQQGNTFGSIYVVSDLNALTERLTTYIKTIGIVFFISLGVVFLLSRRVQRVISDPVLNLAQMARDVAYKKDYSVRAHKKSEDELGQLVDGFNEMLSRIQARDEELSETRDNLEKRVEERTWELENTHRRLLEASRKAGMAEIASNVLHNVGNVLNSLNVSTALVFERVKHSKVENLSRIVDMLDARQDDMGSFLSTDPKGKKIPAYIKELAERLKEEKGENLKEINSLRGNIDHINDIVSMQQSYAGVTGVWEMVNIHDLIEDSLRMNENALKRHGLHVVRQYEEVPLVNVEKHKVLQILINLIRNAKIACTDSGKDEKRLTITTAIQDLYVCVTVTDNGVGIPAENLTRIFGHGFTTRANGHGFGLHSGALAAKEMGGELTVRSEGPGKGASFTLILPFLNSNESDNPEAVVDSVKSPIRRGPLTV